MAYTILSLLMSLFDIWPNYLIHLSLGILLSGLRPQFSLSFPGFLVCHDLRDMIPWVWFREVFGDTGVKSFGWNLLDKLE